ncbi:serine carboxypeptidase-like 13 [Bidens hawaiensis]|uniref:serine carboxypeptidase-like 13 n=1 Tax=Bidens hawaiensis TaxID=980011 RepID=UPI004049B24C
MMKYVIFFLTIQSCMIIKSYSKSIIRTLPGYSEDLPFKLETGYVGVGENEDVQLFYYFVESTSNPKEDPLIFHIPGGPGASALVTLLYEIGPLSLNLDDGIDNLKLTLNPNAWTQMANILVVDIPAGTGFSYSETKEGWISSDSILTTHAVDFIKKFLKDHPKFSRNPLYIAGISYIGIIVPKVTLELYEGNELEDDQTVNIQGYILTSPLTDKFMDFNSRFEYAHRMALISDDIYQSAIDNCHGNYVNASFSNKACSNSLQGYEKCTRAINLENVLEPFCDENDPTQDCEGDLNKALSKWANNEAVQQALNIRQGKVGKWEALNSTLHYNQGKNDTSCYSYDIFSSFSYHKKLLSKKCSALIVSGDHDFTFPYVGVEQWITSLSIKVDVPWKPFYIDRQVGGYVTRYAQNDYSLTFATVKGAGHLVPLDKPKQAMVLTQVWFSSQTYSSDYLRK